MSTRHFHAGWHFPETAPETPFRIFETMGEASDFLIGQAESEEECACDENLMDGIEDCCNLCVAVSELRQVEGDIDSVMLETLIYTIYACENDCQR